MALREPTRPSSPSHNRPGGAREFLFAAFWLALAAGITVGALVLALDPDIAALLRLILVALILLLALVALMLASDSLELGISERLLGLSEPAYWFATSLAVLAGVVVGGIALTLLIPDRPGVGRVAIDLLADLGLGGLVGALAVFAITHVGRGLGVAIYRVQLRLGSELRADRWRPKPPSEERTRNRRRQILRGAVIGAVGLLLSAAYTAAITTLTSNRSGGADSTPQVLHSRWLTIVVPVLTWFVATGVVWVLFSKAHVRAGKKGLISPHHSQRHAVHATAFAVCLLLVGGWFIASTLQHRVERRLSSGAPQAVPGVSVTSGQWAGSSPYLARQFEPRFWLTRDERWSPTSIGWYLAHSATTKTAQFCKTRAGCHELSLAGLACDGADPPDGCAPSGFAEPGLYYRYCEGGGCGVRAPRDPGVSWKVIQYWIFYNYDALKAGLVTQWHQADWEQVSVLVRRVAQTVRPVEVAFSEHCYGVRLPAERVRWEGTHPVSYVGKGSHANYPRPVSVPVRELRCALGLTPRYFGAAGLFFAPGFDGTRVELPLAYVIGLRDRAERARPVSSPPLLALSATPAVTGFEGSWGRDNNLEFLDAGTLATGAGPPAPPGQPSWTRPFQWMFCGDSWLSRAPRQRSATSWICP